ncbi:MAG: DNA translocase FtsK 4TM domain-containing protein, partial [Thermodesulfovibrionia bacterium]|nr:DNA translocase FtsK 4TM domain-containing protein [Thermodesulfovibrionia bacterium]
MERGSRIKDEIKGLLSVFTGLIVIISLISHNQWDRSFFTHSPELRNLLGRFGSNLSEFLLQAVGFASYLIPVVLFSYGLRKIFNRTSSQRLPVFAGVITVLIIATSSILTLIFGNYSGETTNYSGGNAGNLLVNFTLKVFSSTGSYLLFTTLILVSLMYVFQFSIATIARILINKVIFGLKAVSAIKLKKKGAKKPRIMENSPLLESVYEQEPLPLKYPEVKSMPPEKTNIRRSIKTTGEYELPG